MCEPPRAYEPVRPTLPPLRKFDIRRIYGDGADTEARREAWQTDLTQWVEDDSHDNIFETRSMEDQYNSTIQKISQTLAQHAKPSRARGATGATLPGLGTRAFAMAKKQARRFRRRAKQCKSAEDRKAYLANAVKVQARMRAAVAEGKNKLKQRRRQCMQKMAAAAECKGKEAAAKLYGAARQCADISATLRGTKATKAPPMVSSHGGEAATTVKQSLANFREKWQEVGKSNADGHTADHWQRGAAHARAEALNTAEQTTWRPFTMNEWMAAVAKCKTGKSAGPDGIPYEIWKILPAAVTQRINRIFDRCVRENRVPNCWGTSKGVPLFKKGDPTDAYMYRIISLNNTLSKVYERMVLARITPIINTHISTQQHGFCKCKNTQGAGILLAAATGMGKTRTECRRHGRTYVAFIDIRKAYPTVYRPALLTKLYKAGIKGHLFRAVEAMYHKVQNRIYIGTQSSDPYDIEDGLREGSVLSPVLYTIFINDLLEKLQHSGNGVSIANDPQCHVATLGYADDLALISGSPDGLQDMLDIVADYAEEHHFQVSQSKSNVVVFDGSEPDTEHGPAEAGVWHVRGMYNDDKECWPDHIREVDEYQYLGVRFHKNRTWEAQFKHAATKFWGTATDKWHETGAVRMGAGELVTNKIWEAMVAPATDYNPLVTHAALANATTRKWMRPLDKATTASRQAVTGGRAHCHDAARMATGILDTKDRHSMRCATAIANIMRRPQTDMVRKVIRHTYAGRTDNSRAVRALHNIETATATNGLVTGTLQPSRVNARDVRKDCIAAADYATRERAQNHAHIRESTCLHEAIKRAHGTAILPRSTMCGDHLGQMVHQQVRACATRFNAYTTHNGTCSHAACHAQVETNIHVIAQCPRYANARADFARKTGVTLCETTYTDIMAINYRKLQVGKTVLAKALCTFLAQVVRKHASHNKKDIASVAHSLGCNQRRSIIPPRTAERAPD
eukprot:g488.t1